MNYYDSSAASQSFDWLVFTVILLAAGLPLAAFIVWLVVFRKSAKKEHRRRKHRRLNPTLAQTGGLPPLRRPDEPPRGI